MSGLPTYGGVVCWFSCQSIRKQQSMFEDYLGPWGLTLDGEPIETPYSYLQPVKYGNIAAILKRVNEDEKHSGAVLHWWNEVGAVKVLRYESNVVLIERAMGQRSLISMAPSGHDEDACRILCDVAAKLHAQRAPVPDGLPNIADRFDDLSIASSQHGGVFTKCHKTVVELLAAPQEVTVLHGDLHHGNVLDFGTKCWLAIDPKGLKGERTFDFANIFNNPDCIGPEKPTALQNFEKRVQIVAEAACLEKRRLLQWVMAFAGLSASWHVKNDNPLAAIPLENAERALGMLNQ
ncbi:MAG: aminoglycoside phosphotransferase family protein [Paracoccaceae bacterium]